MKKKVGSKWPTNVLVLHTWGSIKILTQKCHMEFCTTKNWVISSFTFTLPLGISISNVCKSVCDLRIVSPHHWKYIFWWKKWFLWIDRKLIFKYYWKNSNFLFWKRLNFFLIKCISKRFDDLFYYIITISQ